MRVQLAFKNDYRFELDLLAHKDLTKNRAMARAKSKCSLFLAYKNKNFHKSRSIKLIIFTRLNRRSYLHKKIINL